MRHEVAGWLQSRIEKFHDASASAGSPAGSTPTCTCTTSTCGPRSARRIHWRELLTFVHRLPLRLLDPWLRAAPT
ncbi:MAG: hypothetical protein R3F59_02815 [Myxococcota bacterium]